MYGNCGKMKAFVFKFKKIHSNTDLMLFAPCNFRYITVCVAIWRKQAKNKTISV